VTGVEAARMNAIECSSGDMRDFLRADDDLGVLPESEHSLLDVSVEVKKRGSISQN